MAEAEKENPSACPAFTFTPLFPAHKNAGPRVKSQLVRHILVGIAEIAEASGVGQKRVRHWIRMGAPIWYDGVSRRWLAHGDELWEWRKRTDLKKLSRGL